MKNLVLTIASLYGMTAVILGAFGAHAFKKILPAEKLASFEVGVRYQMYHAIVLLAVGMYFQFNNGLERSAAWCLIAGTFVFSVSIYLLSFAEHWNVNLKFLGPITPLGGLFMIIGWGLLAWIFMKGK
ncbi:MULTISPECIES: DUF423 domain-containing protein [Empedobacter]|uniref:DUF423 domain-containing protein n=1 Tax=Empedobacter falsenii TaxID=343874 RepID=A0A376FX39_9FLAO|nr:MULTISPECIES: DUF423 domain-containing protein [Empedobacter]HAD80813.1 DUF423 domain-containing protein [Flavobacteriaceae bacterium]MDH1882956.1 DUF423 domain-containing protein [Empedobacter sp. GD03797]MDH2207053.1 DUF423 domain-containing protein [Empedobacter sp. GD03644]QLL59340.1 DUF423 domain-containing protein [Empedobacter falsenii]STD52895.1 Protein of uncharacterised function (DUF423) [Empedobacter falsenii]